MIQQMSVAGDFESIWQIPILLLGKTAALVKRLPV